MLLSTVIIFSEGKIELGYIKREKDLLSRIREGAYAHVRKCYYLK